MLVAGHIMDIEVFLDAWIPEDLGIWVFVEFWVNRYPGIFVGIWVYLGNWISVGA